jgi:hypothetical protein
VFWWKLLEFAVDAVKQVECILVLFVEDWYVLIVTMLKKESVNHAGTK